MEEWVKGEGIKVSVGGKVFGISWSRGRVWSCVSAGG